jgi:hypothetical protein
VPSTVFSLPALLLFHFTVGGFKVSFCLPIGNQTELTAIQCLLGIPDSFHLCHGTESTAVLWAGLALPLLWSSGYRRLWCWAARLGVQGSALQPPEGLKGVPGLQG